MASAIRLARLRMLLRRPPILDPPKQSDHYWANYRHRDRRQGEDARGIPTIRHPHERGHAWKYGARSRGAHSEDVLHSVELLGLI